MRGVRWLQEPRVGWPRSSAVNEWEMCRDVNPRRRQPQPTSQSEAPSTCDTRVQTPAKEAGRNGLTHRLSPPPRKGLGRPKRNTQKGREVKRYFVHPVRNGPAFPVFAPHTPIPLSPRPPLEPVLFSFRTVYPLGLQLRKRRRNWDLISADRRSSR